eukprot:jgi/Mesen1/6423/ME000329S05586
MATACKLLPSFSLLQCPGLVGKTKPAPTFSIHFETRSVDIGSKFSLKKVPRTQCLSPDDQKSGHKRSCGLRSVRCRGGGSVAAPVTLESRGISGDSVKSSTVRPQGIAFFDVDGTITKSNVVMAYAVLKLSELSWWAKIFWVPYYLLNVVVFLVLDRIDRGLFNKVFYRCYGGRPVTSKDTWATLVHDRYLQPGAFEGALERIKVLQRQGFRIVLVSGSLDFLLAPLAQEINADAVFAAQLEEKDGKFTGELEGGAMSSAQKKRLVEAYTQKHSVDLSTCHAYGDSIADLAMLEAVGHPHAVRPDGRLRKIAEQRNWPVIDWSTSPEQIAVAPCSSPPGAY